MNILDRNELAKIVGGSYQGSDGNAWFTSSEHDSMIAEGNWTGGLVQDLGYVGPDFTVQASDTGFSDSESVFGESDYVSTLGSDVDILGSGFTGFNSIADSILNSTSTYQNLPDRFTPENFDEFPNALEALRAFGDSTNNESAGFLYGDNSALVFMMTLQHIHQQDCQFQSKAQQQVFIFTQKEQLRCQKKILLLTRL
ncbi:MAG: hypothetical protein PF444_03065 [Bacteroidales bacterium]|jgi:hypothetical protein|nr:hypothetical protein [Bacteroidales bacterium]